MTANQDRVAPSGEACGLQAMGVVSLIRSSMEKVVSFDLIGLAEAVKAATVTNMTVCRRSNMVTKVKVPERPLEESKKACGGAIGQPFI